MGQGSQRLGVGDQPGGKVVLCFTIQMEKKIEVMICLQGC